MCGRSLVKHLVILWGGVSDGLRIGSPPNKHCDEQLEQFNTVTEDLFIFKPLPSHEAVQMDDIPPHSNTTYTDENKSVIDLETWTLNIRN